MYWSKAKAGRSVPWMAASVRLVVTEWNNDNRAGTNNAKTQSEHLDHRDAGAATSGGVMSRSIGEMIARKTSVVLRNRGCVPQFLAAIYQRRFSGGKTDSGKICRTILPEANRLEYNPAW